MSMNCVFKRPISQSGFTLVEISIALFIIGILIAGSLTLKQGFRGFNQAQEVEVQMEKIKAAMNVFLAVNYYLPCPDTDNPPDGKENRSTSDGGIRCSNDFGYLPYKDLAVEEKDVWGNPFAYKVNERVDVTTQNYINDLCQSASIFAKVGTRVLPNDFYQCRLNNAYYCANKCADICGSFTDCISVDPRIADAPPYFYSGTRPIAGEAYQNLGNTPSTADSLKNLILFKQGYDNGNLLEEVIANSIVGMVVSYGKNGQATWASCNAAAGLTAEEVENCNQDQVFVKPVDGAEDDYFAWMTLFEVKQSLMNQGVLK